MRGMGRAGRGRVGGVQGDGAVSLRRGRGKENARRGV